MRRIRDRLPSPAIVIAILALVAGVTGAAVAQPAAKKAVTKKTVKKIAKKQAIKQINQLAPGLSVASADTSDTSANANALQGKPASAFASKSSEPYREIDTPGQPQFQNSWSNNGGGFSTTAFYKDSQGVVHLKGTLVNSLDATIAFTLPPGYRPSQGLSLPIGSVEPPASGGGTMTIRANGEVLPDCTPGGSTVCHPGIDGLTFRTGQ
jgi:hypothetical protein